MYDIDKYDIQKAVVLGFGDTLNAIKIMRSNIMHGDLMMASIYQLKIIGNQMITPEFKESCPNIVAVYNEMTNYLKGNHDEVVKQINSRRKKYDE